MTPDEILKEILDNIPKTDFKEIYAGGLYGDWKRKPILM